MASLAIAQSFNNMAFSFKGPLVVAAVLILLIGHGLNLSLIHIWTPPHSKPDNGG